MSFSKVLIGGLAALIALPANAGEVYVTPQCEENEYVVDLWARKGSYVMFSEAPDGVSPFTIVVANCQSRKAVGYKDSDPSKQQSAKSAAEDILLNVVKSKGGFSLAEARDQINGMGVRSKLITLPRSHCGCGLKYPPADDAFLNPAAPQ